MALDLAHHRRAELGLAGAVGALRRGHGALGQLVGPVGRRAPPPSTGAMSRNEISSARPRRSHSPACVCPPPVALSTRSAHRLLQRLQHRAAHVLRGQRLVAQPVDDLALLVHHVVVLEQVLADVEVVRLDPLLRALDRAGHQRCSMTSPSCTPRRVHHAGDALAAEEAHQVVLEREEEARGARVALAAGAAAQLAVDAAALVALGADDVQAARIAGRRSWSRASTSTRRLARPGQLDVGAAAGHVGGDGDRAALAGLRRRSRPPAGGTWRSARGA